LLYLQYVFLSPFFCYYYLYLFLLYEISECDNRFVNSEPFPFRSILFLFAVFLDDNVASSFLAPSLNDFQQVVTYCVKREKI